MASEHRLTDESKAAFVSALREWAAAHPAQKDRIIMGIGSKGLTALQMADAIETETPEGEILSEIMARTLTKTNKTIRDIVLNELLPRDASSFPPPSPPR